jgi:hypothetical protein
MYKHARIAVASFGPEAGMVGAGALALDEARTARPEGSGSVS